MMQTLFPFELLQIHQITETQASIVALQFFAFSGSCRLAVLRLWVNFFA